MSLINIDALRATPLQTDPFDYLVVPNFLGPDALAQVNRDYPAIDTAANHALENLSYGPAFATLMDELCGPELSSVLGDKFDMDLRSMPTTVTVRKFCERTDGNIHTDHKSKVITVLVYFNETWEHADGQLRLLRSKGTLAIPTNGVTRDASTRAIFARSFLVAVTNPKGYLFFSAFLPQFVTPSEPQLPQYAALAVTFAFIDLAVMFIYASAGARAVRLLRDRGALWLDRLSGGALLALAGSLALYRRQA